MIILTCRPTQRKHVDLYSTFENLSVDHPQINEIINQVKLSPIVSKLDKKMIEQQLISMACTLNEAKTYNIVLNRWRGGNPVSVVREKAAREERIIRDETIFTITSYSRKKDWTAYVDLPININM